MEIVDRNKASVSVLNYCLIDIFASLGIELGVQWKWIEEGQLPIILHGLCKACKKYMEAFSIWCCIHLDSYELLHLWGRYLSGAWNTWGRGALFLLIQVEWSGSYSWQSHVAQELMFHWQTRPGVSILNSCKRSRSAISQLWKSYFSQAIQHQQFLHFLWPSAVTLLDFTRLHQTSSDFPKYNYWSKLLTVSKVEYSSN